MIPLYTDSEDEDLMKSLMWYDVVLEGRRKKGRPRLKLIKEVNNELK